MLSDRTRSSRAAPVHKRLSPVPANRSRADTSARHTSSPRTSRNTRWFLPHPHASFGPKREVCLQKHWSFFILRSVTSTTTFLLGHPPTLPVLLLLLSTSTHLIPLIPHLHHCLIFLYCSFVMSARPHPSNQLRMNTQYYPKGSIRPSSTARPASVQRVDGVSPSSRLTSIPHPQ